VIEGENRPVMVATLEPGLAWIDMATVDGGIRRRQLGNPSPPVVAAAAGFASAPPLALLRFPGAIFGLVSIRFRLKWAHLQL
jgi:hypothetical protein